jgi:hypothetical protein
MEIVYSKDYGRRAVLAYHRFESSVWGMNHDWNRVMISQRSTPEVYEMKRFLSISLLGLTLMAGGMACAPTFTGPTAPSGYEFSLQVYPFQIWLPNQLYTDNQRFPTRATLTVEVQNAQGQPVDGVPVIFSLPSGWRRHASITPQRVITRNGEAQAVFQATTIGAVKVAAHVENKTQEAYIAIESFSNIKGDREI